MIKSLAHSMLYSLCTLVHINKQSTILQAATIHQCLPTQTQASFRILLKKALKHSHDNLYPSSKIIRGENKTELVGRTCRTHGTDKKYVNSFSKKYLEGKDHLGDLDIETVILIWTFK